MRAEGERLREEKRELRQGHTDERSWKMTNEPLERITEKCRQYWNAPALCAEEMHCVLEYIAVRAEEAKEDQDALRDEVRAEKEVAELRDALAGATANQLRALAWWMENKAPTATDTSRSDSDESPSQSEG